MGRCPRLEPNRLGRRENHTLYALWLLFGTARTLLQGTVNRLNFSPGSWGQALVEGRIITGFRVGNFCPEPLTGIPSIGTLFMLR